MRALERLTNVLEAVAEASPATASDIAARVGLSLSTTVRLLASLAEEDLVARVDSRYHLGTRLLVLAHAAEARNPLVGRALPVMAELRDRTGETVSLHVASGIRRVCIAEAQSRHEVRRVLPVGQTTPLDFGTAGEVLVSGLDPEDRRDRLRQLGVSERELDRRERRYREIAARGWSMAAEDWISGVSGVAAAVQDRSGATVAALIVSGPSQRWTEEDMTTQLPAILDAAGRIGAGYSQAR